MSGPRARVSQHPPVAEISTALHDTTLDDVPDVPARPLRQLTDAATLAEDCAADASYGLAGRGLAALLVELQAHAVIDGAQARQAALTALVQACKVAYILAKRTGRIELAGIAAQRGLDAARLAERPDLVALMRMSQTSTLIGVGTHRRTRLLYAEALHDISALPGPTKDNTPPPGVIFPSALGCGSERGSPQYDRQGRGLAQAAQARPRSDGQGAGFAPPAVQLPMVQQQDRRWPGHRGAQGVPAHAGAVPRRLLPLRHWSCSRTTTRTPGNAGACRCWSSTRRSTGTRRPDPRSAHVPSPRPDHPG